MHCPFCRHTDTKVLDSRVAEDGCSIRRRRCCQACEQRFTSLELRLAILEPLRELDEVAYLRFAAVYKQFETAEDFEIEIASLRRHRAEQLASMLETTPAASG